MFSFALAIVYEGLKMVKDIVATKTKQFLYQPKKDKLSLEQETPIVKYRYIQQPKLVHANLRLHTSLLDKLPVLPSKQIPLRDSYCLHVNSL